MEKLTDRFDEIDDAYLRERKADVQQAVERVLKALMGAQTLTEPALTEEQELIVVAHDLSPADMILFKRHHFGGQNASHGNSISHRVPGSTGQNQSPAHVFKGKRMPGHMGAARHTELGLTVVRVDPERNLLFVRGAIPGAKNGIVTVAKQGGPTRHD